MRSESILRTSGDQPCYVGHVLLGTKRETEEGINVNGFVGLAVGGGGGSPPFMASVFSEKLEVKLPGSVLLRS